MTTVKTCHWEGCKNKIELDTSLEKHTMFIVVGWCPIHHEAFRIYTDLEKKFAREHHFDWPIGSLSYKKHKKALNQLHELAGHRAEQMRIKI